jgi:hypothetical protein
MDRNYPSIVSDNSAFAVYKLGYFVVNFILFLVFNTWIEWSLVQKLRKEIADKKKKVEEEIETSTKKSGSRLSIVNRLNKVKRKKIDQDAKKETRAIVMV